MIKRITAIHNTANREEYDLLCELFRELGFEEGETWQSTRQDQSCGTPFCFPVGEIEFVNGIEPATPNILVEATGLEELYKKVTEFLAGSGRHLIRVSPIRWTHWGSQLFSLSFGVPRVPRIGFWTYDPARPRHTVLGRRGSRK